MRSTRNNLDETCSRSLLLVYLKLVTSSLFKRTREKSRRRIKYVTEENRTTLIINTKPPTKEDRKRNKENGDSRKGGRWFKEPNLKTGNIMSSRSLQTMKTRYSNINSFSSIINIIDIVK